MKWSFEPPEWVLTRRLRMTAVETWVFMVGVWSDYEVFKISSSYRVRRANAHNFRSLA